MICLFQGEVKVLTGSEVRQSNKSTNQKRPIWLESRTNGIVRMKEIRKCTILCEALRKHSKGFIYA